MSDRRAVSLFGTRSEFLAVLNSAELNACSEWDIDFTESLRQRFEVWQDNTTLSEAQEHHLRRIAEL